MKASSAFLVCLLVSNLLHAQEPSIRVLILSGQDEIHNINRKVRTQPVVEVQDQNRNPVQGAAVVFTLPSQGPGGTFENGSNMLTLTTDHQGRATAAGIRLNKQLGPYTIHVTASYQGHTANAIITQTNVSGTPASGGTLGVSTRAWVLLGVSIILIGGAVVAAHNLTSGTNPNHLTITPGIPVVGAP
ncbi:MAG TPA: hypothetical protein VMB85_10885 [Bryobacteraceae bacterium]|nr:hypothetical protein [Bryobacteraceae bacterium]